MFVLNLNMAFILLLLPLVQTSDSICSSSCGDIHNLTSPFRLKNDPKHCGILDYELECQGSRVFMYLDSQAYEVAAINYANSTMRLRVNSSSPCFEVSWVSHSCTRCKHRGYYNLVRDHSPDCISCYSKATFILTTVVLVVVFLGVTIPAKLILGLATLFGLQNYLSWDWSFDYSHPQKVAASLGAVGMYFLVARCLIAIIFVVAFLIYKHRTRQRVMPEEI